MKRERKRIVDGLRELGEATDNLVLGETDQIARVVRILAGTIRWEMRNAKDCESDEGLVETVERIRRAFGEPTAWEAWGVQTPIGKALRKVYGYTGVEK